MSIDLVSVILPTFNRARYINDAIQSVLAQTYSHLELIIVDDGSTDDTASVVQAYLNDTRVRYIQQKNAGAAAARNRGLSEKRGKFVAFLDSDDNWYSEKLSLQMRVMKELPQVAIVCSDFSAKDSHEICSQSYIRKYFSVLDEYKLRYEDVFKHVHNIPYASENLNVYWGNIYETMLFGNIILTSTTLFRREVFMSIGMFNEEYRTLEDYDIFLRATKKFTTAYIDKPLTMYRYNHSDNQLSGYEHFGALCDNLIGIFNANVSKLEDDEFLRKNRKKIKQRLGTYLTQKAYFHFSKEELSLAAQCYWKSIHNNPARMKSYIYLVSSLLPVGAIRAIRKLKSIGR